MDRRKQKDENEMAFDVLSHTVEMGEGKAPTRAQMASAAAKALSMLGASKGGKARAANLSASRRKEIARQAASARWKSKSRIK